MNGKMRNQSARMSCDVALPVAVGSKNWYFVGSEDAGTWAAIFFSLIESGRMLIMDPRLYLATVAKALIADVSPDPATLTPLALRDGLKAV